MAKTRYKCDKCSFTTDRTFNLGRHKRRHHANLETRNITRKGYDCSLCGLKKMSKVGIHHHYTTDHNIAIETKFLTFQNLPEFLSWKVDFEKRTTSRFSKMNGTKTGKIDKRKLVYYQCHRNGIFKSRSSGKRKMKVQSTNKIIGFCPAVITAKYQDPTDTVAVSYVPTHVGHQNDLSRVSLTKDQKEILAEKIKSNVPFDQILTEVRGNSCEENIERIHLLKRKDLHNIKKTLDLSDEQPTYCGNVDSWAKDNMNTGLVRFYKPGGEFSSSYPTLSRDDFLLIVANDAQLDLLGQYGQHCVCFEGSHELDGCDFELTSLLVLDELHQAFPCALMFSKKSNVNSLSVFISVLRSILNAPVAPNVLVTIMSDDYRNAWNSAMVPAVNELYSDWHVAQSWKDNIRKVKGEKKRKKTLAYLQNLLEEKDCNVFQHLLLTFLDNCDGDRDTLEFGSYFKSEFAENAKNWAHCYRIRLGFEDNMKIANLHQVLKYMNICCKRVKRLDAAVHSIMNFIRDQLYKRIASSQESMQSASVSIMRNRHQKAVEMIGVLIQRKGSCWIFSKSSTSPRKYEIFKNDSVCNCDSKCEHCGACVHLFRCSCHDSSIRWNVCKHIHYIAMNHQQESNEEANVAAAETTTCVTAVSHEESTEDLFFNIFDTENPEIPDQVKVTVLSDEQNNASREFEERKKQLMASLQKIIDNDVKTIEHVRICEKAISSIRPALEDFNMSIPDVEFGGDATILW